MTKQETWAHINATESITELLFSLWERWQDEKDYEDIQDYLQVIQKSLPNAYKITKRPFGIAVKCTDGNNILFFISMLSLN